MFLTVHNQTRLLFVQDEHAFYCLGWHAMVDCDGDVFVDGVVVYPSPNEGNLALSDAAFGNKCRMLVIDFAPYVCYGNHVYF